MTLIVLKNRLRPPAFRGNLLFQRAARPPPQRTAPTPSRRHRPERQGRPQRQRTAFTPNHRTPQRVNRTNPLSRRKRKAATGGAGSGGQSGLRWRPEPPLLWFAG